MAVNGTIRSAMSDGVNAYLWVDVDSDSALNGHPVSSTYGASTPLLNGDGTTKPNSQLKTELVALIKAQRASQIRPTLTPIAITGTVVVE